MKTKRRDGDSHSLRSKRRAAEHPASVVPLPPPSFEEACAVVADLYEALPETWVSRWYVADERGCPIGPNTLAPQAVAWCAIGGVTAARGQEGYDALDRSRIGLTRFSRQLGFDDPADASNSGREIAIKMLRMAAGQIGGAA